MRRTTSKSTTTPTPQVRVGIYTRQSVASDLEFGSIDAQREAVEAYVASQRGEGWVALPDRYDDHGFSGGNTERPAFQRLMADIDGGKVDVVAIYKLDRLSRSLLDFAHIVDVLQKKGVALVSVTQQFSTASSMGKLTLNILMSFAEYERQVISERTKDKVIATRRRGAWTGGRPPLGYDVINKGLVINDSEAALVRTVFQLYLEHGGLVATVEELARRGIKNKSWTNRAGKHVCGAAFDKSSLRGLLTNPLYIGRIRCGDEVVEAKHDAIVDAAMFDEVARALRDHRRAPRAAVSKWGSLLTGILRCARCGSAMTSATNVRGNRVYRYYACQTLQKHGAAACPGSRAPAGELEDVVVGRIRTIGTDPTILAATIAAASAARTAQQPELIAEARRVANEKAQLAGQRSNLLDALQHGGAAANAIAGRLAEVDGQVGRLQHRHDEIAQQLAAIANAAVDEPAIRRALQQFAAVWDELVPKERARVLRLLIDTVRYDGQAGEVTIEFRDNGIRALGREATERRPA